MVEENISQDFRLRKINETRHYFLEYKTTIWLVKSTKKFSRF